MKVKLATQVLSHTVAATICMYVSVGALPSNAMGTAEFIEKFDSIFDCVNSCTLHSTKVLKCALSDQTKHQDFMKEAIGLIKGLKVFNGNEEVTGRIRCLKGWVMTLNAILLIWEHLKTTKDFKFLLTRRLNTDPIENFFGTIRQQGGNSDNPTPSQFTSAFRKLFLAPSLYRQKEIVLLILTSSLQILKRSQKQSHLLPSPTCLTHYKLDQLTIGTNAMLTLTSLRTMLLHMLPVTSFTNL